jgi:hypothetical protein
MSFDFPIAVAIISRMADPVATTAAFLIMTSIAMWIESPVIDLMATTTTLAKNHQNHIQLQRFSLWIMAGVASVHALVAFTPIYNAIALNLVHAPQEVARIAHTGLVYMTPWAAIIGWRRHRQGILIRYGNTRPVGIGTAIRVVVMAAYAIPLSHLSQWPGIVIAGSGLSISVAAESLFIYWVSATTVAAHLLPGMGENDAPLTMRKLIKFHSPLTATTMLTLITPLIISLALAKAEQPVLSLAAWQVAMNILFPLRSSTFALIELVITLYRDAASAQILRRFCLGVGVFLTTLTVILWLTNVDLWFFRRMLGTTQEIAMLAHIAVIGCAIVPLLGALQSFVRGLLTAHHLTASRFAATAVAFVTLAGMLAIGVGLAWAGIVSAAAAMTVSQATEFGVLYYSFRSRLKDFGFVRQQA